MGSILSCVSEQGPTMQRPRHDMSFLKSKNIPVFWMVGPPGSGRNTQGKLFEENLNYANIRVAELLRAEAAKETDRGSVVKTALHHASKVPDTIIIDLIKEEMLRTSELSKGYVINNFPRNQKQANLFGKEIDEVCGIIYLSCDQSVLVQRKLLKTEGRLGAGIVKDLITTYLKETKDAISRYGKKVEKIRCHEDQGEVFSKIEAAILLRVNSKSKIKTETDYAQSQETASTQLA